MDERLYEILIPHKDTLPVGAFTGPVEPLIEKLASGATAVDVASLLKGDGPPPLETALEVLEWVPQAVVSSRGYFVSAEQLGWPRRGSFGAQHGLQFPVHPNQPTATCHIQTDVEEGALCGHPLEFLAYVPMAPLWHEIVPALRCEACESASSSLTTDEDEASDYVGELTQS